MKLKQKIVGKTIKTKIIPRLQEMHVFNRRQEVARIQHHLIGPITTVVVSASMCSKRSFGISLEFRESVFSPLQLEPIMLGTTTTRSSTVLDSWHWIGFVVEIISPNIFVQPTEFFSTKSIISQPRWRQVQRWRQHQLLINESRTRNLLSNYRDRNGFTRMKRTRRKTKENG